jgi:GTP-binding protein HflX
VSDALSRSFRDVDIATGVANGKLMAFLARHGEILSKHYHGETVRIHCRLPQKYLGRIAPGEATVTPHDADAPEGDAPAVEDVA